MLKLVFDRFYIPMNEQDIARIVLDFLKSVSKDNLDKVLQNWKFEVVQSISEHEVAFSYRLKELDIKQIEMCLKQIYGIDRTFEDTRPQYAIDRYLMVYIPIG